LYLHFPTEEALRAKQERTQAPTNGNQQTSGNRRLSRPYESCEGCFLPTKPGYLHQLQWGFKAAELGDKQQK